MILNSGEFIMFIDMVTITFILFFSFLSCASNHLPRNFFFFNFVES